MFRKYLMSEYMSRLEVLGEATALKKIRATEA